MRLANYKNCFGCRACEQVCPQKSIIMKCDVEGFLYPYIINEKCTDCKMCIKICPLNALCYLHIKEQYVYAAWSKNEKYLIKSSSGGLFSDFAQYTLNKGGVVYGAAFDESLKLKHVGINDINDLDKLRGSKYLQSDTGNTFLQVKEYLENKAFVFYVGTPCQIHGLKSFLIKEYENLLTADLVCHGVPSQKMFDNYIQYREKGLKSKITDYKFRDKTKFGYGCSSTIKFIKGNEYYIKYEHAIYSPYIMAFLSGDIYRPSCYTCPYASSNRIGDITLGDYWGIKQYHPEIANDNGVSLVLVNTKKGMKFFSEIKDNINYRESKIEFAKKDNSNLVSPSPKTKLRGYIYADVDQKSFGYVSKKYYNNRKAKLRLKASEIKHALKNIINNKYNKYRS